MSELEDSVVPRNKNKVKLLLNVKGKQFNSFMITNFACTFFSNFCNFWFCYAEFRRHER